MAEYPDTFRCSLFREIFLILLMVMIITGCTASQPAFSPSPSPSPSIQVSKTNTPEPTSQSEPSMTPAQSEPLSGNANADVLFVKAVQTSEGVWTFHVTVQHPDTGWEDYADGWDVVTPEGKVLKTDQVSQFTRTLLHPHINEQPFTRSQSGIEIPSRVNQVRVRAHDIVDGFGGQEVVVDLTKSSGDDFEVQR